MVDTHIETPRARVVVFRIKDQAREIVGVRALNPILFQRHSLLPFWGDIEKADGIGSEQPFVAGGDGEIWLHSILQAADAEGQRAERLGEIESERGAELAACFADADEVEPSAAGPVHVR